jgi:hypothetical protein
MLMLYQNISKQIDHLVDKINYVNYYEYNTGIAQETDINNIYKDLSIINKQNSKNYNKLELNDKLCIKDTCINNTDLTKMIMAYKEI